MKSTVAAVLIQMSPEVTRSHRLATLDQHRIVPRMLIRSVMVTILTITQRAAAPAKNHNGSSMCLYIGIRPSERKGIELFNFDAGKITRVGNVADVPDGFLALHPNRKMLYAVG